MPTSSVTLRPLSGSRPPFGTAFDADTGAGIDLAAAGYTETEYLMSGVAGLWETRDVGAPVRRDTAIPYRTRVLVRRPTDPGPASGVTHVEPLHPHRDAGLSWDGLAPHFLRNGDAWVGVTVYPDIARLMRERVDPLRYEPLLVPGGGTEWDVLSDALEAVREGRLGLRTSRVILSGWSATGSFCRVFARERFATARGGLVDAVAIFISSGGAGSAGYPALSPSSTPIDDDDPRRTVRDAGIPVFEILSETESETHRAQLRPDSDEAGDVYRLYQIAGSAHIENWPGEYSTNAAQLAAAGVDTAGTPVRERRTDARSDLIARALIDRLVETVAGSAAPRAPRFRYREGPVPPARILCRDSDGNVDGGIRAPWVQAPLAVYSPHGTPRDAGGDQPAWTPLDAASAASLVGTMRPLPTEEVLRRHGDESVYRARFSTAAHDLVANGLLGAEDAAQLEAAAAARWAVAVGEGDDGDR